MPGGRYKNQGGGGGTQILVPVNVHVHGVLEFIPIAGYREAVQAEVPQAKIFTQLLAKVEGLQKTVSE